MTDSPNARFEIQEGPDFSYLDRDQDGSNLRPEQTHKLQQSRLSELSDLELELTRTRHAAEAARLNAKAAEIELQIRHLRAGSGPIGHLATELKRSRLIGKPKKRWRSRLRNPSPSQFNDGQPLGADSPNQFDLQAPKLTPDLLTESSPTSPKKDAVKSQSEGSKSATEPNRTSLEKTESPASGKRSKQSGISDQKRSQRIDSKHTRNGPKKPFEISAEAEPEQPTKRKPAAWVMSAIFHSVLLIALATFSLSVQTPGDQIAIAGSVAETEELAIENLQIETQQVEVSETDPVPSESEWVESDFGEISFHELQVDSPLAPPAPPIESVTGSDSNLATALSMKSDSDAKMEFCGVQGGGNHFVYLVDSSASMGDAFGSARTELLHSIEQLNSDQRFYVIFFDSKPDYMRLTSDTTDEPRSVYATAENKQALQRWAMTIKMDRGKAPYDALPFALDLNPDVIFLLSDGEFPQTIEDLLSSKNRVENLFGDNGPISIVHTIGYHSREGAERMQRIAANNGGQYRYVPKPK